MTGNRPFAECAANDASSTHRRWAARQASLDATRSQPEHPEQWQLHARLRGDGRSYTLWLAFRWAGPERGGSIHFALSDDAKGTRSAAALLDPKAVSTAQHAIAGRDADPYLKNAMLRELGNGRLPAPDHLADSPMRCVRDPLLLELGHCRLQLLDDGSHQLTLRHPNSGPVCRLTLAGCTPSHGRQTEVSGWVDVGGKTQVTGWGGIERRYGSSVHGAHGAETLWLSMRLHDGRQITAQRLKTTARLELRDGTAHSQTARVNIEPLAWWTSARTFQRHAYRWRLSAVELELDLLVEAIRPEHESDSIAFDGAIWAGPVQASGTVAGDPCSGSGLVRHSPSGAHRNMKAFLGAVGECTRTHLRGLLPSAPSDDELARLLGLDDRADALAGAPSQRLADLLLAPIRHVVDMGGKAWRSYSLLAACEAVGGDPQPWLAWLALPELWHTGSLIVDDIEDRSTLRRGGPAAHTVFGEALCINAGTAAYFLGQSLIENAGLSAERRARIYELHFHTLRAGHAGQALDIAGHHDLLDDVVASGDARALLQRVRAVHRLKSGVPAGNMARIGATLGQGSDVAVAAVGMFCERIGLAFQIVDDVLNLEGYERLLKTRAEDLADGKITYPVALAMGRLSKREREELAALLRGPQREDRAVARAVSMLHECGAIADSRKHAEQEVEAAWTEAEPLLTPSAALMRLCAFGHFILNFHY